MYAWPFSPSPSLLTSIPNHDIPFSPQHRPYHSQNPNPHPRPLNLPSPPPAPRNSSFHTPPPKIPQRPIPKSKTLHPIRNHITIPFQRTLTPPPNPRQYWIWEIRPRSSRGIAIHPRVRLKGKCRVLAFFCGIVGGAVGLRVPDSRVIRCGVPRFFVEDVGDFGWGAPVGGFGVVVEAAGVESIAWSEELVEVVADGYPIVRDASCGEGYLG